MFGKFLIRVVVGAGVAGVLTGGKALVAAGLAIYCTAGLGLLLVLPIAYLIGLICTIWFIPFGNDPMKEKPRIALEGVATSTNPAASLSTRVALEGFIHQGLKFGRSWELIHDQCLSAGWPEEVIQAALDSVQARRLYNY